jgi:hypothetical protein
VEIAHRKLQERLIVGYLKAKQHIIAAGYADDIDWAEGLASVQPDARYVLCECAWVIVNSGFRYKVASKLWPRLIGVFHGWVAELIDQECLAPALAVLNHEGKIRAIIEIAGIIRDEGHERIIAEAQDPPSLTRLPWIGTITCWHLAKVLGVDCVKPDVHLQRAAKAAGKDSPLTLAEAIRDGMGDRLTVIDSVLWRYGEQRESRGWASWVELWSSE